MNEDENLNNVFQTVIEEHKATLDPDNPRDFIDEFIIEIQKQGQSNEAFSSE